MCGICGLVGKTTTIDLANSMLSSIAHRGPDARDLFIDKDVFLGHTRLSIIDLSEAANQPMYSFNQRFVIIFNGEIYNYLEIKQELISKGINFKTSSDTEVIVNGFGLWGNKIFKKLNGIFSIAIWDRELQKATLARDRYGVKPFYFSIKNKELVFGSEIKPLLLVMNSEQMIDHQAFVEFLKFGNSLSEQTLFNNIKELVPGEIIEYEEGKLQTSKFWSITDIKEINISDDEAIKSTTKLLENAVERQLLSDVPVGVFLSGGIDSSLITASASKHYQSKLNTYTAAFDFDKGVNELELSKKVAKHFNTDHHELFIEGKNIPHIVEKLVEHHDAPFSDAANIPLYLMTEMLGKDVKVILQGDGGDEFFAGYRRYALLQKYRSIPYNYFTPVFNIASSFIPKRNIRIKRMVEAFGAKNDAKLMADLLSIDSRSRNTFQLLNGDTQLLLSKNDPDERFYYYNELFKEKDIVQRMLFTDTQIILPRTFLEKVDKSTMANSIEVRVPLLDNELTGFILSLKSNQKIRYGEKKWLLKKALRGIVPDFVLDGKKTGFGVPYENWLKGPLRELMMDTFNDSHFKNMNLFDSRNLNKVASDHINNKANYGFILWKIMHFGIWAKKYKMSF